MPVGPTIPDLAAPSSAALRIVALAGVSGKEARDAELWVTVALTHNSAAQVGGAASPTRLKMLACVGDAYFDLLSSHAALERNGALLSSEIMEARRSMGPRLLAAEKKIGIMSSATVGIGMAQELAVSAQLKDSPIIELHKQVIAALALCIPYRNLLRFFQNIYASAEVAPRLALSFKGLLQEFTQNRGFGLPVYVTVAETGPAHARAFTIRVSCSSGASSVGNGPRKRAAEEAAAEAFLRKHAPEYLKTRIRAASTAPTGRSPVPVNARYIREAALRNLMEDFSMPANGSGLLERALTHPSFKGVAGLEPWQDNQALANIGGEVLRTAVFHMLFPALHQDATWSGKGTSITVLANDFLDKDRLVSAAEELQIWPVILLNQTLGPEQMELRTKVNFFKALIAAKFLAHAPEWDVVASLQPAFREHVESRIREARNVREFQSPTSQLLELAAALGITMEFGEPQITGHQQRSVTAARLVISVGKKREIVITGGRGANGKAARRSLAQHMLLLIHAIHSDFSDATYFADSALFERLSILVLSESVAHAPTTAKEAWHWHNEGLLGSEHLAAGDFGRFAQWAAEAARFCPALKESGENQSRERLLSFYAHISAPSAFDLNLVAKSLVAKVIAFADSVDALAHTSSARAQPFFGALQELLRVLSLAGRKRGPTTLNHEFAALEVLHRRDEKIVLRLVGGGSVIWEEREGATIELISESISRLGSPAEKRVIAITGEQGENIRISLRLELGIPLLHDDSNRCEQSTLVRYLRSEGFLLSVTSSAKEVVLEVRNVLSGGFCDAVRSTIADPLRGLESGARSMLCRVLHDLKNELVACEVAARQHATTRTDQLRFQLAASTHLDAVRRLAGAFGVLSGALQQPIVEQFSIREFLRSYCVHLLTLLPVSIAAVIPRNVADFEVRTSRDFLKAILDNLVKNALEAMVDGGELRIEWNTVPDEESISICVEDSGGGIEPALLRQLLTGELTQSTKPSGSGVGMVTVVSMIRRLGGDLRGESRPGTGTTWTVVVPSLPPKSVDGSMPPENDLAAELEHE